MDKRTLLQLLLFSVVIITGCSKYEDEDYSCNKEVNQWAKSNLNEIKKMKVAEWYSINDIVYQKDLIQLVNDNIRRISFMLLGLAVVLMLISFALISNTIRLGAYSKRFIIHTMKLVGATPAFIRKPFIISNIINGIIGAFIAMALLSGCVYYLLTEFDNLYTLIDISSLFWVFVIVLLLGVVLTAISAWFAVNRYIRMDRDNLYYV